MLQDSLDGSRELGVTLVGGDRPGTTLYLRPSSWTHYRDLDLVPECLPRYVCYRRRLRSDCPAHGERLALRLVTRENEHGCTLGDIRTKIIRRGLAPCRRCRDGPLSAGLLVSEPSSHTARLSCAPGRVARRVDEGCRYLSARRHGSILLVGNDGVFNMRCPWPQPRFRRHLPLRRAPKTDPPRCSSASCFPGTPGNDCDWATIWRSTGQLAARACS